MPSEDVEIRKLGCNEITKLTDILDRNDSWEQLMATIPADLESENSTEKKYSWDDVQLIKQAHEQQRRSCTEILLDEWGTSGRVRPRLSTLRSLLVKAELFRAADYVSELLDVPPPERPARGPAAPVPIPNVDEIHANDELILSSVTSSLQLVAPPSLCEQGEPPELMSSAPSQLENSVEERDSVQERCTCPCTSGVDDFPLFGDEAIDLPYNALFKATNKFDEKNRLGEGSCGTVYLGIVNPGNRKIAIKRFHKDYVPGGAVKQFRTEIDAISKVNHPNLLTLLGFSTDGDSLCLVYPCMLNGALRDALATEEARRRLNWNLRLEIALGVANGIAYLHNLKPQPIVHRDIKTANVLLDDDMTPKLCDFGLVRPTPSDKSLKTVTIGTGPYMASEAFEGDISVKMDVFSFGVILLELLTGLPPADDDGSLADTIFDKRVDGSPTEFLMDDLVDKIAGDWGGDLVNGAANQFLRVALNCIAADKNDRPHITEVVERIHNIINGNAS